MFRVIKVKKAQRIGNLESGTEPEILSGFVDIEIAKRFVNNVAKHDKSKNELVIQQRNEYGPWRSINLI
jgi:hypothetical protein